VTAFITVLMLALAALGVQTWRLDSAQKQILTEHAALEKTRADAEAQARQKEAEYAANVQQASRVYSANVAKAHAGAASASDALDGLRNAISSGTATADPLAAARVDDLARARLVVNDCAGVVQKMAATADDLEARLIGLQEYVKAIQPKP
jgi:hypothetical protein